MTTVTELKILIHKIKREDVQFCLRCSQDILWTEECLKYTEDRSEILAISWGTFKLTLLGAYKKPGLYARLPLAKLISEETSPLMVIKLGRTGGFYQMSRRWKVRFLFFSKVILQLDPRAIIHMRGGANQTHYWFSSLWYLGSLIWHDL